MDIGQGCKVDDKYFPMYRQTFLTDIKGDMLSIGDKVHLEGIKAPYGYLGFDGKNLCVFAAIDGVSTKCVLDEYQLTNIVKCGD